MTSTRTLLDSLALSFMWFTRLPIPWRIQYGIALQQQALAWTPMVGLIVGALGSLVAFVFAHNLVLGTLVSTLSIVIFTGALHEDGWADCWDAVGAGGNCENILKILKDPRLGTYGVISLVSSLAMQFLAHYYIIAESAWLMLPVLHSSSRAMLPVLAWTLPYARSAEQGKATFLSYRAKSWAWTLWVLQIIGLAFLIFYTKIPVILVLIASIFPMLAMGFWYKKLGGTTGDTFGFCQQVGLLSAMVVWIGWPK